MRLSKRKYDYLCFKAKSHNIDLDICLGIYNIETTYRRKLFRICEDAFFILNFCGNKIFKVPIRNITIGVFQVGITSILKVNGLKTWQYYDCLKDLTFAQFLCVIKAMFYKGNVDVFCKKIRDYHLDRNTKTMVTKCGILYNGNFQYALMLETEIERLKKNRT